MYDDRICIKYQYFFDIISKYTFTFYLLDKSFSLNANQNEKISLEIFFDEFIFKGFSKKDFLK